jgi:hypothetical protein
MSDFSPDPILPFPVCVTRTLKTEFEAIEGVDYVFERPLRPTDPNMSIGIVALDWDPRDHEIGQHDPAVQRYTYAVQSFAKNTDPAQGLLEHAILAKMVRTMLYRTESVRLALASLAETSLGHTERTQRWGVRQQRFASNESESQFLYLSTTEVWLETESTGGP